MNQLPIEQEIYLTIAGTIEKGIISCKSGRLVTTTFNKEKTLTGFFLLKKLCKSKRYKVVKIVVQPIRSCQSFSKKEIKVFRRDPLKYAMV